MIFTISAVAILGLVALAIYSVVSKDSQFPIINRISSLLSNAPSPKPTTTGGQPKASDIDYSQAFPPSQRHLLAQASPSAAAASATDSAAGQPPLLRLEEDYRNADAAKRIFSGFTVGEVRALGDFPDYATLSGVPLPSPLPDFDIRNAMPRPYRPFRWSYHQTMCKDYDLYC